MSIFLIMGSLEMCFNLFLLSYHPFIFFVGAPYKQRAAWHSSFVKCTAHLCSSICVCVCVCRLVLWDMQDEKRLSQYLRSLNIAVPRFRPSLSLHTHHEFMKWVDTLISQYISLLFYLLSQWVINAKPHWGFVARWDRRLARWPILSNSGRRLQLVAQRQT